MIHAVQYGHFGRPDVLQMVEVPAPQPGPGEVLVAVHAAGLNPIDVKTVAGAFPVRPAELLGRIRQPRRWFSRSFPRTLGRDFAGTITALGEGVTGLSVGQEVCGTLRNAPTDASPTGSVTGLLVAPASDVIARPEALPVQIAASLGVAAQTACGALRALDVHAGDVLVISGASGGVGSLATQLATERGAQVIGIAGPGSGDRLRSLGAEPVSYTGDIPEQIAHAAGDRPVSKFLDCHGGYGQLALDLGLPGHSVATLVPSPLVLRKHVQFTGSRHARPGDLDRVADLVATGRIVTTPVESVPFDIHAIRQACNELLAGHVSGKLVIDLTSRIPQEGLSDGAA